MLNFNWLKKNFAEVKELVKDCLDGMSSKDKVTAFGIVAIAAIVIANINPEGGDNSPEHLPDVQDDDMSEDDAE